MGIDWSTLVVPVAQQVKQKLLRKNPRLRRTVHQLNMAKNILDNSSSSEFVPAYEEYKNA